MDSPQKVQIVGHVDSNYPDSWRTREDYIEDQRQQRKLVKLQSATLIVAVVGLLLSSYYQYQASLEKRTVEVKCISPEPPSPASTVLNAKPK
jgi:hypothetical protein